MIMSIKEKIHSGYRIKKPFSILKIKAICILNSKEINISYE